MPPRPKGDFKGKTILLLGGAGFQLPAIETANKLGLRTVVCDYLPDNPGQHIADAFYLESTTDRDKVLEIARKERVDGILSFCSDVALPSAAYAAEQLGLPTNPLAAVEVLCNKTLFHPYLAEHGFPCPRTVAFPADTNARELIGLIEELDRPFLIKPSDSSGSKGITVLEDLDPSRVGNALEAAKHFSRNRMLLAEEFINYEYPRVVGGDVFVKNGQIEFWGLMDCLRDEGVASLVPVGEMYPSGLSSQQTQAVRQQLQEIVKSLGLAFGEMNVEIIIGNGGKPHVLELGGRAGGNMIPIQLSDVSGIDLVEANVRFAMGDSSMDVAFEGNMSALATYMLHSDRDGRFVGVEYSPEIEAHVYREILHVKRGDPIERLSDATKNFGQVFLRFDDADQMREKLEHIKGQIHVQID